MRLLIARERPPQGPWDLKLSRGGLVDIEFVAQFLQHVHASAGGPLRANTAEALQALAQAGLADGRQLEGLGEAWRLQQDLAQLLKVALEDNADPEAEPSAFRALLARAGGAADFRTLKARLARARQATQQAYERLMV
jgi:glutamate-ammonia-ligase adenylyltransferase